MAEKPALPVWRVVQKLYLRLVLLAWLVRPLPAPVPERAGQRPLRGALPEVGDQLRRSGGPEERRAGPARGRAGPPNGAIGPCWLPQGSRAAGSCGRPG